MSLETSKEVFERVTEAAPESLYDGDGIDSLDEGYVIFEYSPVDGIGVISSDQVRDILEKGEEEGKTFPLFRGIEASEAYIRSALEDGEGLMTARIEDGEIYSTGYMIEGDELKALMTFSAD